MFLVMFIPQMKPDLWYFSNQRFWSITSDERCIKLHIMTAHYQYGIETSKLFATKPAIADRQWAGNMRTETHSDSDVTSTSSWKLHGSRELSVQNWLSDTARCTCRKSKVHCSQSCRCSNLANNIPCMNIADSDWLLVILMTISFRCNFDLSTPLAEKCMLILENNF